MIFATGGRASGATSTRSRPRSWAAANASSTVSTPSCAPSGAITRIGLMRICRFTRTRGALLFGLSIARCRSPPQEEKKKRTPPASGIRSTSPPPPSATRGWGSGSQPSEPWSTLPTCREAAGEARAAPACRIVAGKLARHERLHKPEPLPVAPQSPRNHRRVVLEEQQPRLRLRPLVQAALRLERHQRLQVVAHDPRQRQAGGGRHQVRPEADAVPGALDQDRLVKGDVPRRGEAADAGQRLGF